MVRFVISFTGLTAAGAVSVSNLKVGDKIINAVYTSPSSILGHDVTSGFASFVLNDGELIQTDNEDLSSRTFSALVERTLLI